MEEQRSHLTELERRLLRKKKKKSEDDNQDDENEDLGEQGLPLLGVEKIRDHRNRLAGMDRVQFKRKKAKVRYKFYVYIALSSIWESVIAYIICYSTYACTGSESSFVQEKEDPNQELICFFW